MRTQCWTSGFAIAVVAALGLAATSQAAVTGTASLTLSTSSAKQLRSSAITLKATKPATLKGRQVTLPVTGGQVAVTATVRLGGRLTFTHAGRSVVFRSLRASVDAGGASISGLAGKKRLTILTANTAGRLQLSGGSSTLSGTPATLTQRAADELRTRLTIAQSSKHAKRRKAKAVRLPSGVFGSLMLQVTTIPSSSTSTTGSAPSTNAPETNSPSAGGPAGPGEPEKPVAATRYSCPITAGSTDGAPALNPPTVPGGPALAPALTSPLSATGALAWRLKQSFVSYVSAGGGTVVGGAFTGSGSYQQSGDRLVLDTAGTIVFCYPAHFFWIALSNPTVTIDPSGSSRLTATVETNQFGTEYGPWRTDIATLTPTGPTHSSDNKTVTWTAIVATLTADGAGAFGGLYSAGTAIDPINLSISVPGAVPPVTNPGEDDPDPGPGDGGDADDPGDVGTSGSGATSGGRGAEG